MKGVIELSASVYVMLVFSAEIGQLIITETDQISTTCRILLL